MNAEAHENGNGVEDILDLSKAINALPPMTAPVLPSSGSSGSPSCSSDLARESPRGILKLGETLRTNSGNRVKFSKTAQVQSLEKSKNNLHTARQHTRGCGLAGLFLADARPRKRNQRRR